MDDVINRFIFKLKHNVKYHLFDIFPGGAALLRARGVGAGSVPSTMVSEGTDGVVGNPGRNSPNVLLYVS